MKRTKISKYLFWRLLVAGLMVLTPFMAMADDDDDDDDDGPEFEDNEVVVKLNPATGATIEQIHADYGTITLSMVLESAGIYLIGVPAGSAVEELDDLLEDDVRLLYAEPNYIASVPQSGGHVIWAWTGGAPTLGAFPDELLTQAGIEALDLPAVRQGSIGTGAVVAVLDTGVDMAHPNLSASILQSGYDYIDDDAVPQDEQMNLDADADGLFDENFGHGTHVAGTVLLSAPEASILPIRVLDSEGRGNVFTLAEAIDLAVRSGADIINLSLGMNVESDLLSEAIERALEANVLVVAAAGNANSDLPHFPAANDGVIGVASVNSSDLKSTYSNWGWWVGVSAPGEAIISAFPGETYATWSGTSMAAPLVAGQAALLKAMAPQLTARDAISIITGTAINIDALNPDWEEQLGAGRIDVLSSLDAVVSTIPDFSNPVTGNLAQVVAALEAGDSESLAVRITGTLGEPTGNLADGDGFLFANGSGPTVLLDLDAWAELTFRLTPGIELEMVAELERLDNDETPAAGVTHELKPIWIQFANGTAIDTGPGTPIRTAIISDWFGYFWELEENGWYYHPSKGLLYSAGDLGLDGWFLSLNRVDWLYASRALYPYIYLNTGGWHYLVGSPYGELQSAYSYDLEEWVADFWLQGP